MNKEVKMLLNKVEELGWTVTEGDKNVYEFSKSSPSGQDFNISVNTEDDPNTFLDNIYSKYEDFDVSEETYLWLDNTGHGTNGAPYDMKEVYEDMEACQDMILDLHYELRRML